MTTVMDKFTMHGNRVYKNVRFTEEITLGKIAVMYFPEELNRY